MTGHTLPDSSSVRCGWVGGRYALNGVSPRVPEGVTPYAMEFCLPDGSNNRASCVGDGALVVGVLQGRAGAGVLDVGGGNVGVVVDDRVAVV